MSDNWHRRRSPDDVPTPTAVAVSDFCRRAQKPASGTLVREALALLDESDDFRVRALTEGEPAATPLGPFAVVDILRGTEPELASAREKVGFYDLVREVAELRHNPPPAPITPEPPHLSNAAQAWATPAPARESGTSGTVVAASAKASSAAKPSLQERIAPQKRPRSAATGFEPEGDAEAFLDEGEGQRRSLPAPKGRFTRLPPTKQPYTELRLGPARDVLAAQLEQYPNRYALLRALSEHYQGSSRGPLTDADLAEALRGHGLLGVLEGKERQAILAAFSEHRGAAGRASWALNLTLSELNALVSTLGLKRETDEIRERYRRDALSPQNLSYRLDLLGRVRYLSDLGIKRRFTESLTGDLRKLVRDASPASGSVDELVRKISRDQGVPQELLGRALEKLGLTQELRKQQARPTVRS